MHGARGRALTRTGEIMHRSSKEPEMKSQAVVSRCGDAYDFSIRAGGGFGVRILGLTETEVDRLIRVNSTHDLRARLLYEISLHELRARPR